MLKTNTIIQEFEIATEESEKAIVVAFKSKQEMVTVNAFPLEKCRTAYMTIYKDGYISFNFGDGMATGGNSARKWTNIERFLSFIQEANRPQPKTKIVVLKPSIFDNIFKLLGYSKDVVD